MIEPWIIDTASVEKITPSFSYPYEGGEEWGYEVLEEEIELHLRQINRARLPWEACVNNFGGRKVNGARTIHPMFESIILKAVLPATECRFQVWLVPTGILIRNWRRDSPTGGEWYELRVAND